MVQLVIVVITAQKLNKQILVFMLDVKINVYNLILLKKLLQQVNLVLLYVLVLNLIGQVGEMMMKKKLIVSYVEI